MQTVAANTALAPECEKEEKGRTNFNVTMEVEPIG